MPTQLKTDELILKALKILVLEALLFRRSNEVREAAHPTIHPDLAASVADLTLAHVNDIEELLVDLDILADP